MHCRYAFLNIAWKVIYNRLLVDRYQVCCLLMAKLHIIAKHVYVQQLPNILLLVVLCMAQIVRTKSKERKQ